MLLAASAHAGPIGEAIQTLEAYSHHPLVAALLVVAVMLVVFQTFKERLVEAPPPAPNPRVVRREILRDAPALLAALEEKAAPPELIAEVKRAFERLALATDEWALDTAVKDASYLVESIAARLVSKP